MSDTLRHVKPAVRSIGAYALAARQAPVKINQNENPYDLEERVKRQVLEAALARPWSRYPDFDPRQLVERLARFSGWRPDGILVGNGSNEMIEALLLVALFEIDRLFREIRLGHSRVVSTHPVPRRAAGRVQEAERSLRTARQILLKQRATDEVPFSDGLSAAQLLPLLDGPGWGEVKP